LGFRRRTAKGGYRNHVRFVMSVMIYMLYTLLYFDTICPSHVRYHNTECVFVEDYSCSQSPRGFPQCNLGPRSAAPPPTSARIRAREVHYSIRPSTTEMCEEFYWDCGPSKKCYKRHKTVYKLDSIREPVGFRLVVPDESIARANRPNRRRAPMAKEPLRYLLSPTTKQEIDANLAAV